MNDTQDCAGCAAAALQTARIAKSCHRMATSCKTIAEQLPRSTAKAAAQALAGLGSTYGAGGNAGHRPLSEILTARGLCISDVDVQENYPFPMRMVIPAASTTFEDTFETTNLFVPRSLQTDALPRTVRIRELKIDDVTYITGGVRAEVYNTQELFRGVETSIISPKRPILVTLERLVPGPLEVELTMFGEKLKVDALTGSI